METRNLIQATCPECRGPLTEVHHHDALVEYECLVGHRYSARAMLKAHSETQERTLWSAVVALEEAANLVQDVADQFAPPQIERLRAQAAKKQQQAAVIRELLASLEPFQTG